MATSTTNVQSVTVGLAAHGDALQRDLVDEMARLGQDAARRMRRKAPKFRTLLTQSIVPQPRGPLEWDVGPTAAHGLAVEEGRKPGKGLPRFFDPAGADIVAWLESKAFRGSRRSALGSAPFRDRELELRDRYMGLSRHVKFKGLKAQPYAKPTADEMAVVMPQRIAAVVARHTARANGGTP